MFDAATISLRLRLWLVVVTGIPFSIFKIGGGMAAAEDVQMHLGHLMAAWGFLDLTLNLWALVAPRRTSWCFLSNLGRLIDRHYPRPGHEQLLLAVDTLATFLVVATMIWFGRIGKLPPPFVRIWEAAVIANILGVAIGRLWETARERWGREPDEG